jgi:uncharacterized phage protein (TIGR01671 family)
MREIKFRAWDEKNKKMLYRTIFDKNWYGTPSNDAGGCHCIRAIMPEDKSVLILMQYTGIKDNIGKEIYEGDVIFNGELDAFKYIVNWSEGKPYYHFCEVNGLCQDFPMDKNGTNWFIKIGNIFEHPELWKERN